MTVVRLVGGATDTPNQAPRILSKLAPAFDVEQGRTSSTDGDS